MQARSRSLPAKATVLLQVEVLEMEETSSSSQGLPAKERVARHLSREGTHPAALLVALQSLAVQEARRPTSLLPRARPHKSLEA